MENSSVMEHSIVDSYSRHYQRFTLRERRNDEKIKILSTIYIQVGETCAMFAIGASFEAKLRMKGENIILSKSHLQKLNDMAKRMEIVRLGRVTRIMRELIDKGVFSENDFAVGRTDRPYKIKSFRCYKVRDPVELSIALKSLTTDGPLVAVIKISDNYHSCWTSRHIYRYDPSKPKTETVDGISRVSTHAVSVVGFTLEESVPCLECQDSRGPKFSRDGFLPVDITSVIELFSFVI